jgi:hypothetical protein
MVVPNSAATHLGFIWPSGFHWQPNRRGRWEPSGPESRCPERVAGWSTPPPALTGVGPGRLFGLVEQAMGQGQISVTLAGPAETEVFKCCVRTDPPARCPAQVAHL